MAIYLVYVVGVILLGWYLLGDKTTEKQRKYCILGVSLFLLLMMSLRYSIGYDYTSYESIYASVPAMSVGEIVAKYNIESTFFLFVKLVASLGLSYQIFLFLCNIIMLGCVMWTIYKHSPVWWVSAALYMMLQFVPYSMNLLRQAMAASIIFAAWGFLKKGKMWQYCLVVLLAGTLHMSALIMIPMGFIMRLPFTLPFLAGFTGLTVLGYLFFEPLLKLAVFIFPKYAMYVDHSIYANQNGFGAVIVPFLLCILTIIMHKLLLNRDKSNGILIYTSLFAFAFTLMITRMYIIERFAIYFFIFMLLLLPEIIAVCKDLDLAREAAIKPRKKGKQIKTARDSAFVTVVILLLASWYMYMNVAGGAHKAYPYVGLWEKQNAVTNNDYYDAHT